MAKLSYVTQLALLLNGFAVIFASVNLAKGKKTEQSPGWEDYPLRKAVDGDISQNLHRRSCTHTDEEKTITSAWWWVDLGFESEIKRIKIYYRSEDNANYKQRLNGYVIDIYSSTNSSPFECYKDPDPMILPPNLQPEHNCSRLGRYINMSVERIPGEKYKNYDDKGAIINLCEFEVYGCNKSYYGTNNCDKKCSDGCNNSRCDPDYGNCTCNKGWKGDKCTLKDCPDGYYGTSCEITCPKGCSGNICDKSTGQCLNRCNNNLFGTHCNLTCSQNCASHSCNRDTGQCSGGCKIGFYGVYCNLTCSPGCKNNKCNITEGNCSDGCKDGFTGNKCGDCPDGYYGTSCEMTCPKGCNGNVCDNSTGQCLNRCNNNLFGTHCNLTCSKNCASHSCNRDTGQCSGGCNNGFYGVYCNLTCSPGCKNNKCNKTEGNCSDGCKEGFTGNKCGDCPDGYYGTSCEITCPKGCNGNVCDNSTGQCLNRCNNNLFGTHCNLTCSKNCASHSCNRDTGQCSGGCNNGFYGVYCNLTCSPGCKNNKCNKTEGNCSDGCKEGFTGNKCGDCIPEMYGQNCELRCSINCNKTICGRNNGSCLYGCITQEMTGDKCEDSRSVGLNLRDLVIAVVAVVVISVIVAVIIIWKRNQKGKQDYENPSDGDQEGQSSTSMRNFYENTPVYGNLHSTEVPVTELRTLISKKAKEKEFEKEFAKLKSGAVHPCTIGQDPDNKIKNRFLTTFPYDHSRVVLETLTGEAKSDYINANYIDGVEERFRYVAAQGPKPNTISDFWRMIWQIKAGKIVMLTNLKEGERVKCEKYWPDASQTMDVGIFKVTSQVEKNFAFYIERLLLLNNMKTKENRKIKQYHFTMWPDHGTPDPLQLVLFHRKIKNAESSLNGPCVVHCSAGIGRTGTFIALDALHGYADKTGKIDVFGYVIRMRNDRMNMIQTVDQYIVLHEALLESFEYAGRSMTRGQFLQICNEMQNGKDKKQTHIYKEYQSLLSFRPAYGVESYKSAMEKENRSKCRNSKILAVEKYRPYLISFHSSRTNFINAVILPSCSQQCGYLVTLYPLKDTVVDLWCMIFDHDSMTVAVLDENGDKNEKSEWYPRDDEEMDIGIFSITKVSGPTIYSSIQEIDFTVKHKDNGDERNVKIFLLRPWPTGTCIPPNKTDLLKQLELVDNHQRARHGPVTVICSDGAQCCGLFCTVRNAIQNLRLDEEVDVFQTVRQFQIRRPQFFATLEAYQFCYDMIKTYLESSNLYANSSVM